MTTKETKNKPILPSCWSILSASDIHARMENKPEAEIQVSLDTLCECGRADLAEEVMGLMSPEM